VDSPIAKRNVQRRSLLRTCAIEAVCHRVCGAGRDVAQPHPDSNFAPVAALRPFVKEMIPVHRISTTNSRCIDRCNLCAPLYTAG
jgi:hypothetical protein